MIGHMTKDSLKSDPGIMLDFCEAGGGCSPADRDSLNCDRSHPTPSYPELKNKKEENFVLTRIEFFDGENWNDEALRIAFKEMVFGKPVAIRHSEFNYGV